MLRLRSAQVVRLNLPRANWSGLPRARSRGQALVSLLVVSTIFVLVVTGILIMSLTTNQIGIWSRENQKVKLCGLSALGLARENLLRDTNYTGETLTLEGVTSIINVTGETSKLIEVESQSDDKDFLIRVQQSAELQPDGSFTFGKIQILTGG